MKNKLVGLFLFTFFIYYLTSPGDTPYNYFSKLALAFSQGNIYLTEASPALNELIPTNNGFYVPYAPMPALILVPFALLLKSTPPQILASLIFGSLLVVLTAKLGFLLTKNKASAFWIAVLTGFGTNVWFNSSVGSSWYFAQILASVFLTAAIIESLSKNRGVAVGILLGAAYLSRGHLILSLPFFILNSKTHKLKNALEIISGALPFAFFNFYYNFARFGVIWDKGYTLIPGVLNEPWYEKGIFHHSYIFRHLKLIFTEFPHFTNNPPFVLPEHIGMAIWITTPAFLLLLLIPLKERLAKISLLACLLISIPILTHGTVGFSQFGYRFAIDVYPFVFLLISLVFRKRGVSNFSKLLIIFSIIVNAWGVVWINKFGWVV